MSEVRRTPWAAITILAAGLGLVLTLYFTSHRSSPSATPEGAAAQPPTTQSTAALAEASGQPPQPTDSASDAPRLRPNDSLDLESTNPIPPLYLNLVVQPPEGQPLPQATVRVQTRQQAGKRLVSTQQSVTDAAGAARVAYPSNDLEQLEIAASSEDYGGRKMVWNPKAGDIIPASYTLKLGGSVSIGGIIVDAGESPIPGVKLSFHRFWMGGEEMNRKGVQADFALRDTVTDGQGSWKIRGLPAELLDHISVNVQHPNFLPTNITVGTSSAVEKELRAGAYKIVLRTGLEVRGLVLDENSNPIPNATVWAGRRNFRDRQQTNSDAQGRFGFRNIAQGDVLFSVMASGRAPDSKTFTVRPGMDEIVFKLGPGSVIRALVQNEAAEPIAGVRVVLEGNADIGRTYEFSTTTGSDGRFEWDARPAEPMQFYFGKEGYAALRNKPLQPGNDNIVTLRKPRQIQGQVLDADTSRPLATFRVARGRSSGLGRFFADSPGNQEFSDPNGQFTISLGEEEQNAVRVQADDYAEQTQNVGEAKDGVIAMEFRLKPSPALRGKVIGPDGSPVPGAQVALINGDRFGGSGVSLRNGQLQSLGSSAAVVTTDVSGQFALGSTPEAGGRVVAAGEAGFGSAPVEQVRQSGVVVLQLYGQIEGELRIAGAPAGGRDLLFTLNTIGITTDLQRLRTTTDEQGKFRLDKVPAGEGEIVRLIKTSPNSWSHSHSTSVTIEPGKVTFVQLGDSGAVIRGRVRLSQPPTDGQKLSISGTLSSSLPAPQTFTSRAEAEAFLNSLEQQALMKQRKRFVVAVEPDGSFLIDSVPPGEYSLRITAGPPDSSPVQRKTVASGNTTVSVPESAGSGSVLDVGEVLLAPSPERP